mgnify:CR=1 FL=1
MNAKKSNSKIVMCISSAEIGGAEKQLCLLSKELFTRGINLEVWFLFKGGENIKILETHPVQPPKTVFLELEKSEEELIVSSIIFSSSDVKIFISIFDFLHLSRCKT